MQLVKGIGFLIVFDPDRPFVIHGSHLIGTFSYRIAARSLLLAVMFDGFLLLLLSIVDEDVDGVQCANEIDGYRDKERRLTLDFVLNGKINISTAHKNYLDNFLAL